MESEREICYRYWWSNIRWKEKKEKRKRGWTPGKWPIPIYYPPPIPRSPVPSQLVLRAVFPDFKPTHVIPVVLSEIWYYIIRWNLLFMNYISCIFKVTCRIFVLGISGKRISAIIFTRCNPRPLAMTALCFPSGFSPGLYVAGCPPPSILYLPRVRKCHRLTRQQVWAPAPRSPRLTAPNVRAPDRSLLSRSDLWILIYFIKRHPYPP